MPKNSDFWFWYSLWFADFPYFSIWFSVLAKNINGFSDLIFDAVFGHLEVGDQVTGHTLIQHSNRISKLSGLSSQMVMLDLEFSMKLSRAVAFCDCKIAIL